MILKNLFIVLIFLIISSCSTTKLSRGVASLDSAKPSVKGSCSQVMNTFIRGRKIINKNGLSTLFPSTKEFSATQIREIDTLTQSIGPRTVDHIPPDLIERVFQTFSYSKLIQSNLKEVDPVEFSIWFRSNADSITSGFDRTKSISDNFDDSLILFKKWSADNGFSFKNIKKLKRVTKAEKKALKMIEESAMTDYNNIVSKKISDYINYQEFLDDMTYSVSNFHIFEENFEGPAFLRWLSENELLSKEVFLKLKNSTEESEKMGDLLSKNYSTFIPFSKKPDPPKKSVKEKIGIYISDMFNKKKGELEDCVGDLDCAAEESRSIFQRLIGSSDFKKHFSCLGQFPQARNAMYADFIVTWSMLGYLYKENNEEFQRFPWEAVVSGLVFTPIMSEVNCQASFQTRNAFGGTVNIAKQPSKSKAFLRNWRRITGVSIASGVGLVGLGVAFNELYAALGHPVENTDNLKEQIKMLPFMFMWSGVLGGLKDVAVLNPLKHKVIPKLAGLIQKKTGVNAGGAISMSALNIGLSSSSEYYSGVGFNEVWKYHVLPKYLDIIGYDRPGDQELNGDTSVIGFDENTDIYITEYDEGIKTSVTLSKSSDENGKEYVQVENIGIEIPDYILEDSVRDIPKVR